MPFAVRRISDGAYATKSRCFDENAEKARTFSTASAAAGSLRYMYDRATEPFDVEVVELELRVVAIKSRYTLTNDPNRYRLKPEKQKGPLRTKFREQS